MSVSVYKTMFYLANFRELKNDDGYLAEGFREIIDNCDDTIKKPDFNDISLSMRKDGILITGSVIIFFGIILGFAMSIMFLLNFSETIINITTFLSFNLAFSGMFITTFRYSIAAHDHAKFLRMKVPESFKINKLAHSTWFDLLAGTPIAILIMMDLMSR